MPWYLQYLGQTGCGNTCVIAGTSRRESVRFYTGELPIWWAAVWEIASARIYRISIDSRSDAPHSFAYLSKFNSLLVYLTGVTSSGWCGITRFTVGLFTRSIRISRTVMGAEGKSRANRI